MSEIAVSFTKEEFKLLISQMFIGNWVMTSDEEGKDAKSNDLMQKMLKKAQDHMVYHEIEYDELYGEYFLPVEAEDELVNQIEEYNEDVFLDELIDVLVEKDLVKNYSPRMIANMTDEKHAEIFGKAEEKYIAELNAHGFEHLELALQSS